MTHRNSMEPIHLVFLHPHFTLPGGAGNVVLEVARRLPPDRYRVTVLCIRVSGEYRRKFPGIAFVETGGYLSNERLFWLSWPVLQRKINGILDRLKPDVLLPSVLPANWWAFLYRRRRRNTFCLWYCHEPSAFIHSPEWQNAIDDILLRTGARILTPLLKAIDRRLVRRNVDCALCNSRFTMDRFRKTYGIEPRGYIHPGVDLDYFSPTGEKSDYLFMISRLTRFKNVPVAIEAFSRLKNRNYRLLIGGEGEEKEALRLFVDRMGLGDRVILTGGVAHEKLPSLYSGARVLIFTTKNEPFGMVPVEALACGTPVIASNSGGVRETVRSGFNGVLLDRMTAPSLSEAIDRLLSDSRGYDFIRRNARKSVEGFSWDRHVDRFRGFLHGALEEKSGKERRAFE